MRKVAKVDLVIVGLCGVIILASIFYLLPKTVVVTENEPIFVQEVEKEVQVQETVIQETNLERAKRLLVEDKRYKHSVKELEQKARDKGWNISKAIWTKNKDYVFFLEKLLSVKETVNTNGVEIVASNYFSVGPGYVYVDTEASIEEILVFLKK
ncbi:MAG: hypothetical protein A3J46_03005 [Candidatus Yanofskybacteria bacterium RIFCSPHIGHO2_02_FULL_41_11]|uniref:Uncharacterized protein n=1 Tax=Candidatus Yanofskybacteria bacterium RIFCSPHIGHO2_02_FULL_41_11 TaxID=1802675 RepID=A0A1F8F681_9BACT|nr:MAG: hypothetical protein A3J46_03005 [Candidatus Yanofskybacteria bacterium RIFCSPHIGHO2_02_FULL_41_11]